MKVRFFKAGLREHWTVGPIIVWSDYPEVLTIGFNFGWWDIGIEVLTLTLPSPIEGEGK